MSDERRHSYRYKSGDERATALLRLGGKDYPAELHDESAGGFSVSTAPHARVRRGQMAALRIYSGWYEVEVIHQEPEEAVLHLGLRRVCDIPDPTGVGRTVGPWWLGKSGKHQRPHASWMTLGIFAAVSLSAVLFLQFVPVRAAMQEQLASFGWGKRPAVARSPVADMTSPREPLAERALISPAVLLAAVDEPMKRQLQQLHVICSKNLSKYFDFTMGQRSTIERIVQQSSKTLAEHYQQTSEDPAAWQAGAAAIIQDAVRRVEEVLSPEQRKKLQALFNEPPSTELRS